MQAKGAPPAQRTLLISVVLSLLAVIFVLPWAAMAVSGAWRAGAVYFLPLMLQARGGRLRLCPWCWNWAGHNPAAALALAGRCAL